MAKKKEEETPKTGIMLDMNRFYYFGGMDGRGATNRGAAAAPAVDNLLLETGVDNLLLEDSSLLLLE